MHRARAPVLGVVKAVTASPSLVLPRRALIEWRLNYTWKISWKTDAQKRDPLNHSQKALRGILRASALEVIRKSLDTNCEDGQEKDLEQAWRPAHCLIDLKG
jgi:hypothetical protein